MVARWPSRFRTARSRSTLAATGVVAVALIVGGFAVLALQRRALVDAIDTSLIARVEDLTALVRNGTVPRELTVPGDDTALVQIVDEAGDVIVASANIDGEGPIAGIHPLPDDQVITTSSLPIGSSRFRLVAASVAVGDQTYTIYSAASLAPVSTATGVLAAILLGAIPILIAFVGLAVWFVIGQTLEPVEAIRAQVAAIGDRELDRRVPVPDTEDEIARLAETMNEMLDRLEQAAEQQRRFLADASHELRSPLAAIRSQLEVDLAYPAQADWSAANADILDEALRMQRLVDDLLLLARSDSGTLPTKRQPVDLDDIVFDHVMRLEATSEITIDTGGVSGAQVLADSSALGRLVRNLLENAVRYAKSQVEVRVHEADGVATFIVDDDGPGIPAADRERVLDRFTRLDEARDRDHGGAGLGLAIAKEITHLYGGVIEIEDSPRGGARVIVRLPT